MRYARRRGMIAATAVAAALVASLAPTAAAHPDGGPEVVTDDPSDDGHEGVHFGAEAHDFDIDGPLLGQDEFDVISGGPYSKVEKNLAVAGRGERLEANVTTDVWAHDGYAYTGTFSSDCSDGTAEDESGILDLGRPQQDGAGQGWRHRQPGRDQGQRRQGHDQHGR